MLKLSHQKINQFQKVLSLIDLGNISFSLLTCMSILLIDDDDTLLENMQFIQTNANGLLTHVIGQYNISK